MSTWVASGCSSLSQLAQRRGISSAALMRKKTKESNMAEDEGHEEGPRLKRCLSRLDVIAYGISTTVGAGLFVITGACLWAWLCKEDCALWITLTQSTWSTRANGLFY